MYNSLNGRNTEPQFRFFCTYSVPCSNTASAGIYCTVYRVQLTHTVCKKSTDKLCKKCRLYRIKSLLSSDEQEPKDAEDYRWLEAGVYTLWNFSIAK